MWCDNLCFCIVFSCVFKDVFPVFRIDWFQLAKQKRDRFEEKVLLRNYLGLLKNRLYLEEDLLGIREAALLERRGLILNVHFISTIGFTGLLFKEAFVISKMLSLQEKAVLWRKEAALKKAFVFQRHWAYLAKRGYLEETIIWENKRFYKDEILHQNGKTGLPTHERKTFLFPRWTDVARKDAGLL